MKSSYFLSVFYCIVSFSVGTCVRMCYRKTWSNYYLIYNGSSCTWPQNISFEEKVHLIAEKVGMWENPTALFHSKDFAVIYRYPKTYQKHVKRLLANSKVALVHKKIALYSMEQLDLDAYLSLAEDCYQLYCKSMIPDSLLQMALGYCLAGDHPMVKHYQDEHVVRFFNTIKKYNFSDEFQNNIEMIRTGAMWEHWQHNQVSTNFKWEKKPIPFVKTIMHIIDQSKYYKHYIDLEGYIDGADFRMLYEHPEYYIEDAYQLLRNPFPDPHKDGKHTLQGRINELIFNTMRKLDEKDFMLLFKQQYDLDVYTNLIGGIGSSYYDTLLLKPYPFSFKLHHVLSLSIEAQHNIKRHQHQQAEQDRLRKHYDIPLYDHHKPFYYFDLVCEKTLKK